MKKQTIGESDDFNNERLMSELNPNEKLIVEYLKKNDKIVIFLQIFDD
jgi:hypothetical protein